MLEKRNQNGIDAIIKFKDSDINILNLYTKNVFNIYNFQKTQIYL